MMFGFAELSIPAHGFQERTIGTAFATIKNGPLIKRGSTGFAIKQQLLWRNWPRNRRISRLARSISVGDVKGILHKFPTLAEAILQFDSPRIAVLVEGLDHALALAQELDEWPIIAGPSACIDGLPSRFRARLSCASL